MSDMQCDLLVIGAGMAGLSAAARASELGAKVIVIEKGPEVGGSALYSGGYVWTVQTLKQLQAVDDGDPVLGRVMVDGFKDAIGWLRQRDVMMSRPVPVFYGRGYSIDVQGHLRHCAATVTSSGGHVVVETTVRKLIVGSNGAVIGVVASHRDGDIRIEAPWTILATGGMQGSAELRERFMGPAARNLIVRANPHSQGDGYNLAASVGAGRTPNNRAFYGHLMTSGVALNIDNFARFSQIHSEQSVLLNEAGERFTDEGRGDYANAQSAIHQSNGRVLLVWDEVVQTENVMRPYIEGKTPIDKLKTAVDAGGAGARVQTLAELAAFADTHGFCGGQAIATIEAFNRAARDAPELLCPVRTGMLRPLDAAPYYVMVVVPAITFTHGGIKTSPNAEVLRPDGSPIGGLLVAGVDVGDVYNGGYAGGLSLALAFALRAVETAGWKAPIAIEGR